jgi:hypothetical protein
MRRSLRRHPAGPRFHQRAAGSPASAHFGDQADPLPHPLGTLRDWEQGRAQPDRPTQAYLKIIACEPERVERLFESEGLGRGDPLRAHRHGTDDDLLIEAREMRAATNLGFFVAKILSGRL